MQSDSETLASAVNWPGAIFKDDFSHKLTSSRFTHVCYKREKKCAFFCFRYYLIHFPLPAQNVVYLNRTLIVPSSSMQLWLFLFPVAVFIVRDGTLCVQKGSSYTLKIHTTQTLSSLSAIWAPLYPAKGFKRLLCCSSLYDFRCQSFFSSRKWPVLMFILARSPPSPTV